jgi:hypothetical protein
MSELVCGNQFCSCICNEDAHEGDVHKCACGGSWEGDGQGPMEKVKILSFPDVTWNRPLFSLNLELD